MDHWYYAKKRFAIFPGFRRAAAAPFLHDHYRARAAARRWPRLLVDGIVAAGFRGWVPLRARAVAARYGLGNEWARWASGVGRRRFWDPNDIAVFRVAAEADTERYLRRFEYAALSKAINPAAWRADCVLADKARFAARCAVHGLPTPRLLARVRGGQAEMIALPAAATVVVKPTGGLGGAGFAVIAVPEGLDSAGFARLLAAQPAQRRGDWMVQERVPGHPAIADLALDALSTARVTTLRDERGAPEIVTAVLRFAGRRGAVVDNLAAGGLLAGIDEATGTLGPACWGRRPGDATAHPITGAAVAGRVVPDWPAARDLVLRAHEVAFPEYSMIGWDVGIGADGPVLIEGNGKPGLFAAQRATRTGIGETRFGALLAHHLAIAAECAAAKPRRQSALRAAGRTSARGTDQPR